MRSGDVLERYLRRVFDAATPSPGADPATTDVWDWVSGLEVGGAPLTREEMFGIANVLLAGGRDTVIKLITGLVWHLVRHPQDRAFLADNPKAVTRAVGEVARYLSPLPKMERVLPADREVPIADRDPSRYVLLSFLSANHDRTVWGDPERIDFHREQRAHLAFGLGRHSCMGMNITEHEARAFLGVLLEHWPGWRFDGEPVIVWETDGEGDDAVRVLDRFEHIRVVPA